jgi:mismatch-specific thymine-DNA glycosylase
LVIVGFNPGKKSGTVGHHYAGKNNQFYDVLFLSGLGESIVEWNWWSKVPRKFHYSEDAELLNYGIGFTNIVERTTSSSNDLSGKEMRDGASTLIQKLVRWKPKIVCFNGMGVYKAVIGAKEVRILSMSAISHLSVQIGIASQLPSEGITNYEVICRTFVFCTSENLFKDG